MIDETEEFRREYVKEINGQTVAADGTPKAVETVRAELEKAYGADNVWDTQSFADTVDVLGFLAPFCVVKHKKDGVRGSVEFTHCPRFYFNFTVDS